jgi:hypothetical protein
LFGINADGEGPSAEDQEDEDIEVAIEKELAAMKEKNKPKDAPFDLLKMNVDCVLFMRTRSPVDPHLLVREMCRGAAAATDRGHWRSRFINKLTPITYTGRATEKGLEEVAQKVLYDHFQLAEGETGEADSGEDKACSVSTSSRGTFSNIAPFPGLKSLTSSHLVLGKSICHYVELRLTPSSIVRHPPDDTSAFNAEAQRHYRQGRQDDLKTT